MKSAKRKELEERLRRVVKSKIRRLREASNEMPGEEEDDVDYSDSQAIPTTPTPGDVEKPVAPSGDATMDTPPPADTTAPEPPAPPTDGAPEPPIEEPGTDPSINGDRDEYMQAKVKLFYDKLKQYPELIRLMSFDTEIEQSDAIKNFARLINVPDVVSLINRFPDKDSGDVPAEEPPVDDMMGEV